MILTPTITAITVILISFSGLLFVKNKAKKWLFKNIKFLVTFAAGIFLMTSLGLVGEAQEHLTVLVTFFSVISGFVLMSVIHTFIPETHHHHDDSCPDCVPSKKGTKLLISDSIHNFADGIILVVAFSASQNIGLIAALSIFIHEFVQEISEFFVLRQSGYTTKKAIFWNFISALTILLGVWAGTTLTQESQIQSILLGVSAGAFFHVVFHDLLPYKEITQLNKKLMLKHITLFLLGIVIIWSIRFLSN